MPDPAVIRPMVAADVHTVARLHCAVMPDGVLARLGAAVLAEVYAGALTCPAAVALVSQRAGEISGFLLAATDTGAVFRHTLHTRAIPLCARLARVLLRDAGVLPRLLMTIKYPTLDERRSPSELLAMGVSPGQRGNGQAAGLVNALNWRFVRTGVTRYTVATYSSNLRAQAFYQRLGFRPVGELSLYKRAWVRFEMDLMKPRGAVGGT